MYEDKPPLDELMHYGMKFRSGRYPWGSGGEPYQHSGDFLSRVEELKKGGWNETPENIEKEFNMKTTDYRLAKQRASHERRQLEVDRAKSLAKDGLSSTEIGKIMEKPESTIRSFLNKNTEANMNRADKTADLLRTMIPEKKLIDVGSGTERELGVSKGVLQESLAVLQSEGYHLYPMGIKQTTNPGQQSNTAILASKEISYSEAYARQGEIKGVSDYHSIDGGLNYQKLEYPASMSSKRIKIRYGDEGGVSKDGVMEIRRGVPDLDMGGSHYAQVRILVDGTHYLKGMAMYSDDMPNGADIVFNTNKMSGTDKMKVLKPIGKDPENPFGANIKAGGQTYYDDPKGKYIDPVTGKKQSLSPINKLKEEGDWNEQSVNLSSQFLSKQPMRLIEKQLNLTYADKESEYKEIASLTNPTVKKKRLLDFADECDSATVHLKAAALPRQKIQVILPLDKIKDNEIYAPNYESGEKVVLIRYPHGGTFEIPELVVNNKNKSGKSILGNATDAVGINSKVAERLSGADFDGDTVTVIPVNGRVRIKTSKPLEDLKGFDPKVAYSTEGKTGVKLMTKADKQKQMGTISNLITDMTLKGAHEDEIARAVKHSMVVIDAEKHKLDYKQSEKDNGIAALKKKWQVHTDLDGEVKESGAATLISRKKQDIRVAETQGSGIIDPSTGKITYKKSGRTYVDKKTGEVTLATKKVKLMEAVPDARILSSGTLQEEAYADYANKMKALANTARKEYKSTGNLKYDPSAAKVYDKEVDSLKTKLDIAARNAPKERVANAIANSRVKAKMQDNPEMDKKEIKKTAQLEITKARVSVGASGKESKIMLTDREWEAIQAGAVSEARLSQILRYADSDDVVKRSTPRSSTTITEAKRSKVAAMRASGYLNSEIAKATNLSPSAVSKLLNGKE